MSVALMQESLLINSINLNRFVTKTIFGQMTE